MSKSGNVTPAETILNTARSLDRHTFAVFRVTDANGQVTFTTMYPGWYQGRATHIHAEVVRNGTSVKVTQFAFPEDAANAAVYGTGVYASRGTNPTANTRDSIFADSINSELATVTGDPASGLSAAFRIGISG